MAVVITGNDLARDHVGPSDTDSARRYFRKFESITGHLGRVAAEMEREGSLNRSEVGVLAEYIERIAGTFRALGMKYLMTGRDTGTFFGSLAMDTTESGFRVHRELLTRGSDFSQARAHIEAMPDRAALIDRMVGQIVRDRIIPTKLQFALSQRLYYDALLNDRLFWSENDPRAIWLGWLTDRRTFTVHWAVYDSQIHLPVVYLMELEDTGRTSLPKDAARWPAAQAHLVAQSMAGLKVLTIASGFDKDFDDLHPKRLRRIHLGPMYSAMYTRQVGPIHDVLTQAPAPDGQDWCLAWTVEDLQSERWQPRKRAGSGRSSGRCSRWTRFRGGAPTPVLPAPSARSSCPSGPIRCWPR